MKKKASEARMTPRIERSLMALKIRRIDPPVVI
jgi:hypothetical protein